jgi:hypothetical protein
MFAEDLRNHDHTPVEDKLVVLRGVRWSDYQRQLELRGDRSVPRFAYLEGDLVQLCTHLDRPMTSQAMREYRAALSQPKP